jgi:flagellar basal body-associated protein FliL
MLDRIDFFVNFWLMVNVRTPRKDETKVKGLTFGQKAILTLIVSTAVLVAMWMVFEQARVTFFAADARIKTLEQANATLQQTNAVYLKRATDAEQNLSSLTEQVKTLSASGNGITLPPMVLVLIILAAIVAGAVMAVIVVSRMQSSNNDAEDKKSTQSGPRRSAVVDGEFIGAGSGSRQN